MLLATKSVLFTFLMVLTLTLQAQENPYVRKAEVLHKQGNYQGALLEYENAINHDSMNYQLWLKKGSIYTTLKDWSNASRALEKVVELNHKYIQGYLMLRKIYVANAKIDKAILVLNKAYQNDTIQKHKIQYKADIINMLDNQNQLEKAFPHIQEAKQLTGNNSSILFYEAKYFNLTGSHQKAIESAQTGLNILNTENPKQVSKFYYEIGYAYHKLEDYENARLNLAKANFGKYKSLVFKMTHIYHYRIAKAYFTAQDYENSTKFVEIALKMSPNFKKAKSLEKQLIGLQKDNSQLIDSVQKLADNQKHPILKSEHLVNLAKMQYKGKDYSKALSSVTEALKLAENLDAEFLKAVAYFRTQQYDNSAQTLEQLLQLKNFSSQEDKAVYYFMLGLIAEQAKNEDLAIENYKKASFGDFKYAVAERLESFQKKN